MPAQQIPAVCNDFIACVSFSKSKPASTLTNISYKKQFSPLTWQVELYEDGINFKGKSLDGTLSIPYSQISKVILTAYARTSPTLGIAATSCHYMVQAALYLQDGTSLAFETFEYEACKEFLEKVKEHNISIYDKYQLMDMLCTKTKEAILSYFEQRFDAIAASYGLAAFKNDYQR